MPAAFARKGSIWSSSQPPSLMLKTGYFFLALSVCGLFVGAYTPSGSSAQKLVLDNTAASVMDPFTKVAVCAPLNVKIVPGTEYKVSITADEAVKDAISARVEQETLSIEVARSFRTDNAVQITVSLPHNKLQAVHNKGPETTVAVEAGFQVRHFTGINAGAALLSLKGVKASEALLKNSGVGQIIAKGDLDSVQIEGDGVSKVYLKGSLRKVYVQLSGISEAHLAPTSDDLRIDGSIDSLSKVYYTRGKCDIGGGQGAGTMNGVGAVAGGIGAFAGGFPFSNMGGAMNMFGGGCQKVDSISFPDVKPTWSCGIEVSGKWTCAGSAGGGSSASTSGNGQSFTSTGNGGGVSMSSSSGNGNSYSSSTGNGNTFTSSNGNGRTSMFSTDEGTVIKRRCPHSEADLWMYSEGTAAV